MSEQKASQIKPTEEQQEAIAATKRASGSIMLDALAGTGKTSTLGMLSKEVRGPALALAFNKSIAEELKKKFPPNFEVKTMNALGFGALRRGLPGAQNWKIEPRKVGMILTEKIKREKLDLNGEDWESVRKVVTGAQLAGLGAKPQSAEDFESWEEIASEAWVEQSQIERICEIASEVLEENNQQTKKGLISFDDQVYFPVAFGLRFAQYPTLMVDEAQDLNRLNHAILSQSFVQGSGRLIVCGDPRQSIYGFRGSVSESMGEIQKLQQSWENLRLTLTFRCPRLIVERQQSHAPGYRAFETNPEGFVDNWRRPYGLSEAEPWDSWSFAKLALSRPSETSSMAVLCRNNSPLLSLAFRLIRQGVGVRMLGQDLGKGLVALSRKIEKEDKASVAGFAGKVRAWMDKETESARLNKHEERVAHIRDRGECLLAVAETSGASNVGDLRKAIEKLFNSTSGLIVLGSIHRSKGLEWDCVLHLDPWRIPSRYARKAAEKGDLSQLKQEWNLKYVCETRSKHTLIEANLEDFA